MPRHHGPVRFDLAIYHGVDELDALGPLEVLRSAGRMGADIEARLVTLGDDLRVIGAHGLRFEADACYHPGADVLVVPGGGWITRAPAGAWAEVQRGDWLPLLGDAAAGATTIASVCTGAMVVAHAGVIGSRRATTHHRAQADLAAMGATVVPDRVVDDGDLLTCAGVTAGIDLALWLVERHFGPDLATEAAGHMEHHQVRPKPAGPGEPTLRR